MAGCASLTTEPRPGATRAEFGGQSRPPQHTPHTVKAYKISASAIDNNGVRISSDTAETLGDAYGVTYLTRDRAEEVRDELATDMPAGYESSTYEVEEIEIAALVEGDHYDVASVRAVAQPLPAGQNVGDYFTQAGRYLGPDEDGVAPQFATA